MSEETTKTPWWGGEGDEHELPRTWFADALRNARAYADAYDAKTLPGQLNYIKPEPATLSPTPEPERPSGEKGSQC